MKPALTLVVLSEHEGDSIYMITSWLLWRPVIFWTTMKEWIIHMHMTSMLSTQINRKICNSYLIPIYINSNTPPTSSPKKTHKKTSWYFQPTDFGNSTARPRCFDFCEQVEARLLPFHLLRHPLPPKLLPGVGIDGHHRRRDRQADDTSLGLLPTWWFHQKSGGETTSWGWVVEIPLFTGFFSHHPWWEITEK